MPPEPSNKFELQRLLPDLRGWAVLGFFALAWRLFEMIKENPALTENQGFMLLTQAVIVSGLIGSVAAFLFSSSKGSSDARVQEGARTERLAGAMADMAAKVVPAAVAAVLPPVAEDPPLVLPDEAPAEEVTVTGDNLAVDQAPAPKGEKS